MSVYQGEWSNQQDVIDDFRLEDSNWYATSANPEAVAFFKASQVLLAVYDHEGYEGYAYVLFYKDGKLYEVHGSHCSCMGLEDQWDPEETDLDTLLHLLENGKGPGWNQKDKIYAALALTP
jgi:hypothetical protein